LVAWLSWRHLSYAVGAGSSVRKRARFRIESARTSWKRN